MISTVSTGGSSEAAVLKGKATYTDYFYPVRSTTTDNKFFHIGNITNKN
jgi:hypothetical protein